MEFLIRMDSTRKNNRTFLKHGKRVGKGQHPAYSPLLPPFPQESGRGTLVRSTFVAGKFLPINTTICLPI